MRFDNQAPLNFRLMLADVNLGLLRLLTDSVAEARGAVEGALTLAGTVEAPRLSGSVRVADGSIRFRDLVTPIDAITLAVRVDENAARITEGSARAGGGQVRLEGAMRLNLSPAGPWIEIRQETPLVVQASPMHLQAPPVLDGRVEGALRLWGTVGDRARPATLEGRIAVSEGTVGTAVTLPSGNGQNGEARFPLVFQRLQLEVGRDLAVRVGDARVVLQPQGALVLTGTLASPQLEGTIQAQRGVIVALGNTFDLQEGVATFRPVLGARPQISVRAVTRVGPNVITLTVRGVAPGALSLDLESDPPQQQSEIAMLLGQQAGLTQLLGGDATALLRAEITRRLFAPVTLAVGRALGLSELAIEYDFEQPLRLRAGRLLLRDLYLTVTTTFEETQRWWWALEYRFTPGWQLAVQIDPQGRAQAIVWYARRF
jgi:translocation and assembly module TamB